MNADGVMNVATTRITGYTILGSATKATKNIRIRKQATFANIATQLECCAKSAEVMVNLTAAEQTREVIGFLFLAKHANVKAL